MMKKLLLIVALLLIPTIARASEPYDGSYATVTPAAGRTICYGKTYTLNYHFHFQSVVAMNRIEVGLHQPDITVVSIVPTPAVTNDWGDYLRVRWNPSGVTQYDVYLTVRVYSTWISSWTGSWMHGYINNEELYPWPTYDPPYMGWDGTYVRYCYYFPLILKRW